MAPNFEQENIYYFLDRRWLQLQQETRTIQLKARNAQKENDLEKLSMFQKQILSLEEELEQINSLTYYYNSVFFNLHN